MDLILKNTDDFLFGMCCARPDRPIQQYQQPQVQMAPNDVPFGREDEIWFKRPEKARRGVIRAPSGSPRVTQVSPRKQPVILNAKPLKASHSKHGQFRGVVADMFVVEGYEAHTQMLIDHVEGANRLAIRNCNNCNVHVTADVTHLIVDGSRNTQVTVLGCRSVEVSRCMWLRVNFRQHHGLDPSLHLMDSYETTFHFPSSVDISEMPPKVHA
eukprot:CAMPEP_0169456938 /NCGR_PEP_ID=MMETSP1042-20121227/16615_1 /TAXON_ID=464988 /ORGANISM="Hemiselmis andersenii, Strain CCMP1180" /LENGTH=212 /DNA_ID=CAMNT_0009569185 /DNA_START=30 /DNA_END=664 /DNA_ORIENTATION=+